MLQPEIHPTREVEGVSALGYQRQRFFLILSLCGTVLPAVVVLHSPSANSNATLALSTTTQPHRALAIPVPTPPAVPPVTPRPPVLSARRLPSMDRTGARQSSSGLQFSSAGPSAVALLGAAAVATVGAVAGMAAAVLRLVPGRPAVAPEFAMFAVGPAAEQDPLRYPLARQGRTATALHTQRVGLIDGSSSTTSSGSKNSSGLGAGEAVSPRVAQFQALVQDLLQQAVRTGPAGARRTFQAATAVLDTAREFLRAGAADPPPVVLRKLFERLGSTYIKLGQFIASSPSLFPAEYVKEFQKCLDSTPPVAWPVIRNIIERDLGRSIDDVFESVDRVPLATASIAQVHAAVLKGGRQEVVIKVLKPGVADVLDVDLTFLTSAAKVLEFLNPRLSRVSLADILSDIRKSMMEEVDFTIEAQNIRDFQNYLDKNGIEVATAPFVYPAASSKKVLTMERLRGAPLIDLASIRAITDVDPELVLINALNVWLGSVLASRSFHADVHAGNLLVLPDGRVGFIDFGIVGRISPITFQSVEKFLLSLSKRDFDMMAVSLVTMGATGYNFREGNAAQVNMAEFSADLKKLFEGLLNLDPNLVVVGATDRTTGETVVSSSVSFDQEEITNILVDLVEVTEKHGLRLPREFILLVKQILYFDRYVQALAPDLQVLNDDRVRLAQDAMGR
eukprot:EG_transcript_4670